MENVQNLQNDVEVFLPQSESRIQNLVAMHFDHPVTYALIVATLYATKKFHGNPLFFTLQ